jgi:hypothetical protein
MVFCGGKMGRKWQKILSGISYKLIDSFWAEWLVLADKISCLGGSIEGLVGFLGFSVDHQSGRCLKLRDGMLIELVRRPLTSDL